MTTISRFHVSVLQASALPEIVAGEGIPALGSLSDYISAFAGAPTESATWLKPWGTHTTGHKYWTNLLGGQYAKAPDKDEKERIAEKALTAWKKQVPLRRIEGFAPSVLEELSAVTVTCDRFLYPSGVGAAITATFEGTELLDKAEDLHRRLSQDAVFIASDGKARKIDNILLFELNKLEQEVLKTPSSAAVRSPTWMETTIAGAEERATSEGAVDMLTRLCYPGQAPGWAKAFDAKKGKFSETIRVAGEQAMASWAPKFSTTNQGRDGLTCYHHNVVLSTLQTLQLLTLVRLAGGNYRNAPARAQELYARAVAVLGWIYGGRQAYSTCFSPTVIDDSGLVPQVNSIRNRLLHQGPLHRRESEAVEAKPTANGTRP